MVSLSPAHMRPVPVSTPLRTVLVVDDEPVVRVLLRRVLEQHGYRVLTVASGAAALALVASRGHGVSLVIADLTLQDVGGEELALRFERADPAPRVLLTSGAGADPGPMTLRWPVFSKPLDTQALVAHIARETR